MISCPQHQKIHESRSCLLKEAIIKIYLLSQLIKISITIRIPHREETVIICFFSTILLTNMTLSRQMYPENPQHLLNHFKEATSKLYGYLVVDLKHTTQECLRLRSNVLEKSIKGCQLPKTFHLGSNLPSNQTYFVEQNMQSCDHCGLVFENIHDLQRHITR